LSKEVLQAFIVRWVGVDVLSRHTKPIVKTNVASAWAVSGECWAGSDDFEGNSRKFEKWWEILDEGWWLSGWN